jgi:3-oxoacyl-[acyl-carrier protein] reductase
MDLGLAGRVAFIAGASSGLGFAVAHELIAEGCRVAICSRSRERIDEAARKLRTDRDAEVLPIVCDVTDEDSIVSAITETVSQFASLNIVVTNAGGPPAGYIDDFSSDEWRDALELNLISTINLCRASLIHLRRAARLDDPLARILMITSLSAKQPIPNLYLSNTARAGVQGFAKSLSEELGPEGITVNTILPGYTRTDRLKELTRGIKEKSGQSIDEVEADLAEHTALKRIADPSEFAAAAAFLVSKRASYVTGTAFTVDGGRVKHLL